VLDGLGLGGREFLEDVHRLRLGLRILRRVL
jgi:hypothetical protein